MFNPSNIYKKMYQSGETILMRNPLYPVNRLLNFYKSNINTADYLKQFFSDKTALEALYIGSPDLYQQLNLWLNNQLDKEDKKYKTELSLLKYIIRMSSRCTPFGLFASCSLVESADNTSVELSDINQLQRFSRLDMDYVCQIYTFLLKNNDFKNQLKFKPNNSLYLIGDNYRYVEYRFAGKGRSYHLVQLENNPYLQKVLELSSEGKTPKELSQAIVDDEVSLDEATTYINDLILNQVICSEVEPNVTGTDFVNILIQILEKLNIEHSILKSLKEIKTLFTQNINQSKLEIYKSVPEILKVNQVNLNLKTLIQVDTLRPTVNNKINKKVSEQILQSATLISLLSHKNTPNDPFSEFKNKFMERYESQFVPLVEVLDTESGIGYGKFSNQGLEESPLIGDLPIVNGRNSYSDQMPSIDSFKWELYEKSLLNNLTEVELDEKMIEKLSKQEINYNYLPDSIYGMVKIHANSSEDIDNGNYKINMHGLSGPSAASLWGRFCHLDSKIENASQEFLRKEEQHHPEAIYAEIVHLPESRIGNILMRPHLRSYEIPYLCQSILPKDNQIPVNDLMVGVEENKVVLKSKRLNKQIIPRMSNAHNFSMTSLPIYQFLCDLQYQMVLGFGWSWGGLESRKFLPRVTYDKTILCKARWRIIKEDLNEISKLKGEKFEEAFQKFIKEKNLPEFVFYSQGDNELLLSLNNDLCRKMIVEEVMKYGQITLTESLENESSFIRDEQGNSYSSEFLFGYSKHVSQKNIQVELENPTIQKHDIKRNYTVGSEWLYVKIYCGNKTADSILSQVILPLCNQLEEDKLIEKYFFIRYSDPGNHLRIRFYNSNNRLFWTEILDRLNISLLPYIENRLISKIQNDTYQREVERYGFNTMDLSETIFYYQSKSILNFVSLLSGDEGEVYRWQVGLRAIEMMFNDFKLTLEEKIEFVKRNRNGFVSEFNLNTAQKKAISDKYYGSKQLISQLMEIAIDGEEDFQTGIKCFDIQEENYQNTILEILEKIKHVNSDIDLMQLLSSYVHMFVNRLFVSNQRAHEMVLYDYLMKYYEGKYAREKHNKSEEIKEEVEL